MVETQRGRATFLRDRTHSPPPIAPRSSSVGAQTRTLARPDFQLNVNSSSTETLGRERQQDDLYAPPDQEQEHDAPSHQIELEEPDDGEVDSSGGQRRSAESNSRKKMKGNDQSTDGFYGRKSSASDDKPDDDSGSDGAETDDGSCSGVASEWSWDSQSDEENFPEEDHVVQTETTKKAPGKTEKTTHPRAKNAREFVARLHEKEDADRAREDERKRSAPAGSLNARKKQKASRGESEHDVLSRLQNEEHGHYEGQAAAPEIPTFEATTYKKQFRLLKQSIPAGADTRHVKTQEQDLIQASKIFGYRNIKAVNGMWLQREMKSPLHGFQMTAVRWMLLRELDRIEPYGGVLADVMGLGKTIMSLACITGNPADNDDIKEFCRTTLVVVPNITVALQWKSEVQRHCKSLLASWVAVYDSHEDKPLGDRRRMRVLITTYSELMAQYPKKQLLEELKEKYQHDTSSFDKAVARKKGFLFKQKWYRVILDEAHAIKNIQSRTAMVCCALVSKYRWALSGTPLANSAEEFYPYLKFLGCKFTDCQRSFNKKYLTSGKTNRSFHALISIVMYRRTLNDTFMGSRVINLPESKTRDIWVPLSKEETIIAKEVIAYYDEKIQKIRALKAARQKIKREDEGEKSHLDQAETQLQYAKLTRLRQATSHVFNLETMFRKDMTPKNIECMRTYFSLRGSKRSILDQIMTTEIGRSSLERYTAGLQLLGDQSDPVFGGMFEWHSLLDFFENEHKVRLITCSCCKIQTPPVRPVLLARCGHYYCEDCFLDAIDDMQQRQKCQASNCMKDISDRLPFQTLAHITFRASNNKNFQEPGKDSNGVSAPKDASENGCFVACARLPNCSLPPSAKLTATMAVVGSWLNEYPKDKIIVFVQFIMTSKVLGSMLQAADVDFLYYLGGMTQRQKNQALVDFRDNPAKKVLVATSIARLAVTCKTDMASVASPLDFARQQKTRENNGAVVERTK